MNLIDLYNTLLVRPIITVLVGIYQILFSLGIPFALGFSIIVLTVIIRLILYPLTTSYLKTSKKMQEIAPHLSKLKDKHKGDSMRLQQETMKLYKEHGVNPAAGCLPSLVQLPIVWALYSVLQQIVSLKPEAIVTEVNKLVYSIGPIELTHPWDQNFFGIPLGQNPSQLISVMPLVFLVPVLSAVSQLIQSKMLITKPVVKAVEDKNKQKDTAEEFSSAFQTQSLYIFPAMIGFFSYSFPIGISLYWITQTIFGILQQYHILGIGGLREWLSPIFKDIKK